MNQFKIFKDLTRLNKPIGFMLLFWPCSWGLAFASIGDLDINKFLKYLVLFFLGSVLMRSAGCIFNDIIDKDFDKKVKRTKNRPIASGKISILNSFIYVIILCLIAFLILIQFNLQTIILGMGSMLLAFTYPFMKRVTYWPQLFLGFTFNWGIIMAWTSMGKVISIDIIVLYISAIFWTLGYDTIYGAQDMSDDEIIGLKSTAIKFKKNIRLFVFTSYSVSIILIYSIIKNFIQFNVSSIFFCLFVLILLYQLIMFKKSNIKGYLDLFKLNNFAGLFLFLCILLINF